MMKGVILTLLCIAHATNALWPAPSQYTSGNTTFKLHSSFSIIPPSNFALPDDLNNAMKNATQQLSKDNMAPLVVDLASVENAAKKSSNVLYFLQLNVNDGTNSTHNRRFKIPGGVGGDFAAITKRRENPKIKKRDLASIASDINQPFESRDESYTLDISLESSVAYLTATTALGLLRGLQTFTQLVYTTQDNDGVQYIRDGPYSIKDEPAYPVRGQLLDTARNYYPIADIKRTLNAMSWVKMNYFHWHITDSQSWPLVIPSLPELSGKAAYSSSEVYTLEQVKSVVQYANAIGIEVLIEIDSPGHTASIALSYPDLVSCTQDSWLVVAAEPNPGQIKPTEPKAIELMQKVYSETMEVLPGKLFGTGGDEINLACFQNDTSVQDVLKAKNETIVDAIGNFVNATHTTVFSAGKTPVIWEDTVVGDEAIPLNEEVIVIAWRGSDTFTDIVEAGHRVIQASYELAYLDCGMGGWVGPGDSWCPYVSWWGIYGSLDSLVNVTESQKPFILGGQAALWSEQAGPEVLDSLLWPRAAAVGEVWWLGESGINGQGLDANAALARIHDLRYRMVQRGIAAKPLQPHWCALRPDQCLASS